MQRQSFQPFASFTSVTFCVAVFVCVASVIACSGTTTGNGTSSSGGKGTGLFGGGTSGGTGGTSGSTAGGGSATVVPTSCTAVASDDTCTACLKSSCCSPTLQCANEPECNAVFTCAAPCSTQQCTDDCIAAHPSAQATLRVFVSCEQQFCVTACGGSSSSTSGGTSGTSGGTTDTCLEGTPQDPSYCPNMPTRQTVKDCPNGPPSAQCVLSPTGAANVYCCP